MKFEDAQDMRFPLPQASNSTFPIGLKQQAKVSSASMPCPKIHHVAPFELRLQFGSKSKPSKSGLAICRATQRSVKPKGCGVSKGSKSNDGKVLHIGPIAQKLMSPMVKIFQRRSARPTQTSRTGQHQKILDIAASQANLLKVCLD